jgi:hypothetical protein
VISSYHSLQYYSKLLLILPEEQNGSHRRTS